MSSETWSADQHFTIDALASVPPSLWGPESAFSGEAGPPAEPSEEPSEVTDATVGIPIGPGAPSRDAPAAPPSGIPVPPGAPAGYRGYGVGEEPVAPAPAAESPSEPFDNETEASWFAPSAGRDYRGWLLRLPDGAGVLIDQTLLIGRSPDASLGPAGARLVAVDDPARTVSRSHLLVGPGPRGEILLRNISTLNALVVIGADGEERKVVPGGMTILGEVARVLLGAYPVALERV